MTVSSTTFFLLQYGVPAAAILIMLLLTVLAKGQKTKAVLGLLGLIFGLGYYFWFDFSVHYDSLPVYTADSCTSGETAYRLPFGESSPLIFDNQPDDPLATWIAVVNRTDRALVFTLLVYTRDGVPPSGNLLQYDGYVVPPGETHGLTIAKSNLHFLETAPEQISADGPATQELFRYEVQCGS
jgi:hypothetical protein